MFSDTKSKDLDEEQHQDLRIIWCQVIDGYANRIANTLVKLCSELAVVDEESNVDNIRTIKAMSKQGSIAAHDKIFCMLQALYHFREGPLLDGPATVSNHFKNHYMYSLCFTSLIFRIHSKINWPIYRAPIS